MEHDPESRGRFSEQTMRRQNAERRSIQSEAMAL
jgi:hypothetical protein